MKKNYLIKTLLLLCALVAGSGSVWAEGEADWSYTVVDGDASKLNTTDKTFTVDANHVWSYDGTTVAAGTSPAISIAKYSGIYGLKFGESGSKYYSPVILSTGAFSNVNVTKVSLYVKHNGSKSGTLTVKQGDITIGTATTSQTSDWITVTSSTTNKGTGGTLEIKYEVAQALYINKIEVWYESTAPAATLSTTSLSFGEVEVGKTKYLTFTVTPANLTSALSIASNNAKYTVSPTSIVQATTTATTITVTAAPTTLNDDMDGTITISGGGLASNKTVTLSATPYQVANVTLAGTNGTFKVGDETVTSITSRVGSKATVKAVPARGYSFTSWSAEGATPASSTNEETEFTFNAASVTLTATFTEIPKYTVTFADNSETITEEYGGEGISLPSRDAIADYTFEGWVTDILATETTTAPASIMLAGSNYKPSDNITLYPVYKRTEGTEPVAHTVNIGEYASANNWTTNSGNGQYGSIVIDSEITVKAPSGGNNGKVYTSSKGVVNWRVYTGSPTTYLTIESSKDNIISVKVSNTASSGDWGLSYGETALTNGVAIEVSGKKIELAITNKTFITDIEVVTNGSTTYYTSTPVTTVPVTITAAKYATYCGARNLNFSTTGIKAYTAEDGETSVTLNEITDGKVPANTPVVLYKADADGTAINVPVIASADAPEGTNDLNVVGEGGLTGVDYVYVLAMNPTIGFYLWDKTQTLNEGKIYLQGKASYGARLFLGFDESTGIDEIVNSKLSDSKYFDLQGRRVVKAQKGLYIMNGKKVLVK